MCDFAADADAARQLLVGRVLTVERVRQLNAKDYFYQMLKDNPEMLKIYSGTENELLKGAIDCHIHASPDFVHRSQDMIQIAIFIGKEVAHSPANGGEPFCLIYTLRLNGQTCRF